jgi:hypothetical protein
LSVCMFDNGIQVTSAKKTKLQIGDRRIFSLFLNFYYNNQIDIKCITYE